MTNFFNKMQFALNKISITAMCLIIISGCASKPHQIENMITANRPLYISLPEEIEGEFQFTFSSGKLGDNLFTGITTGGTTGATAGALLCVAAGPAAWLLCGAIGGLIGGTFGGTVGAIYGLGQDITAFEGKNDQINDKIDSFILTKDVQNQFLTSIKDYAHSRYPASDLPTETNLTVLFTGIGLNYIGDDNAVLITQAYVELKLKNESGKEIHAANQFTYISPPNNVKAWANGDEYFYTNHFQRAYRIMSEDIINTISN